jgi:hypothetical protein
VIRIATIETGTFRSLILRYDGRRGTLEDDEVNKEAGEFGHFFSDPVGDLSSIFCQRPDIRDRTKDQVNDKVGKQIEEMPNPSARTKIGGYLLTLATSASAFEIYPCHELNHSKINGAKALNKVYNNVGRNPWINTARTLFELKNSATFGRTLARYAGSRKPLRAPIGMAHKRDRRPLIKVILQPRMMRCRRVV